MKTTTMAAITFALHVGGALLTGEAPAGLGVFWLGLIQGMVILVYWMPAREHTEHE